MIFNFSKPRRTASSLITDSCNRKQNLTPEFNGVACNQGVACINRANI